MKKYLFIIAIFFLAVSSCKKNHNQPDDISLCVHRIYPSAQNSISSAQMDTVKMFFNYYHLSLNDLQVGSVMTQVLFYRITHIACSQFVNGLLLFYGEISFHFSVDKQNPDDNISYSVSGHRVTGVNADSFYTASDNHAANIFLNQISKDNFSRSDFPNANWADSCYNATLGILQVSSDPSKPKYELMWKVTLDNYSYPYCFVNAKSGKLFSYDDGIRF